MDLPVIFLKMHYSSGLIIMSPLVYLLKAYIHWAIHILCFIKAEYPKNKSGKCVNISLSRASLMTNFHLPTTDKSDNHNFEIRNLKFICRAICFFVSWLIFKILPFHPFEMGGIILISQFVGAVMGNHKETLVTEQGEHNACQKEPCISAWSWDCMYDVLTHDTGFTCNRVFSLQLWGKNGWFISGAAVICQEAKSFLALLIWTGF